MIPGRGPVQGFRRIPSLAPAESPFTGFRRTVRAPLPLPYPFPLPRPLSRDLSEVPAGVRQ